MPGMAKPRFSDCGGQVFLILIAFAVLLPQDAISGDSADAPRGRFFRNVTSKLNELPQSLFRSRRSEADPGVRNRVLSQAQAVASQSEPSGQSGSAVDEPDVNEPNSSRFPRRASRTTERLERLELTESGIRLASHTAETDGPADRDSLVIGAELTQPGGFSFNFRDAPWDEVLTRLAAETGLALHMDTVPPGSLNYYDPANYTPAQALDVLNGALLRSGFLAIRSGQSLVVVSVASPEAISPRLIPRISSDRLGEYGRNELLSTVFEVHSVSAYEAMRDVEPMLGPLGRVSAIGNANRLLVTDLGENLRRIHRSLDYRPDDFGYGESAVFQLENAPAVEVATAIREFMLGQSAGGAGSGNAIQTVGYTNWDVSAVAVESTNSVLVKAAPRYMAEVKRLINQLDMPPDQVVIQALLVEVELGQTDEFGVELGFQDSVISQTSQPGFLFNTSSLGNNTSISPGRLGAQGLSNFGVGRVNGDLGFGGLVLSAGSESINVLLRALSARFKLDVLSRPQIRTVDNAPAHIQIGQQVPVVDGVSVNAVGSANPVIRQDNAGIILEVIPRISQTDRVTIDVMAEKSQFQIAPGNGVVIFTDATSGNVIEAPVKDVTTAETTVSAMNGQTIVLGGMITKDKARIKRKVPWLGDLPVIGAAFRYDFDQCKRKELLIFLTPKIIRCSQQSERLTCEETSRLHTLRAGAEEIHGPIPGWCETPHPCMFDDGPCFCNNCCQKRCEDSYCDPVYIPQSVWTEPMPMGKPMPIGNPVPTPIQGSLIPPVEEYERIPQDESSYDLSVPDSDEAFLVPPEISTEAAEADE